MTDEGKKTITSIKDMNEYLSGAESTIQNWNNYISILRNYINDEIGDNILKDITSKLAGSNCKVVTFTLFSSNGANQIKVDENVKIEIPKEFCDFIDFHNRLFISQKEGNLLIGPGPKEDSMEYLLGKKKFVEFSNLEKVCTFLMISLGKTYCDIIASKSESEKKGKMQ